MQRLIFLILTLIVLLPSCSSSRRLPQPCGSSVSRLRNKAVIKEQIKSPYKISKSNRLKTGGSSKRTFKW